jgi:hypothetical protein
MLYCSSCGSTIPEGQGKSCSMCYGDPFYGKDGYALRMLEEQTQQEYEQKEDRAEHNALTSMTNLLEAEPFIPLERTTEEEKEKLTKRALKLVHKVFEDIENEQKRCSECGRQGSFCTCH